MRKNFNLKKYFLRTAFYDDARGYALVGSRAWPNCIKHKMDGDKKSRHEAYTECIKEYNEGSKDEWLLKYTESYPDNITKRTDKPTKGSKGLDTE